MSPIRLTLFLILLMLGCDGEASRAQKKRTPKPAVVVTSAVTDDALVVRRRYFGEVWAASEARLSVAEAGRVLKVHVAEGSRVKKGQLLIELDDRLARAELQGAVASKKQALVQSDQAGRDAERYSLMEKENVVSELEAQQQRSTAESLSAKEVGAEASVRARRERVARHRLVAPFEGTITTRAVDPGDWLTPGTIALALLTEERLEVHVSVPAALLDKMDSVDSVKILHKGTQTPATVISYVGALDRKTRTGLLRIESSPAPPWLRAGDSAEVEIELKRVGPLNMPSDAIIYGAVGTWVMRAVKGEHGLKAEKVDVRVLEEAGDRVLVEAPELKVGERIVSRGNERLRPGQALTLEGSIAPAEKN